ncbi:hypothetical protein EDD22DRAFT_916043, partial [Suillus occidentalis]
HRTARIALRCRLRSPCHFYCEHNIMNAILSNTSPTYVTRHVIYILSDYSSPLYSSCPWHSSRSSSMQTLLWFTHPRNFVLAERRITPLPSSVAFGLSAIAPTISVLSGKTWQTTAWWCTTAFLTWVVHASNKWIVQEQESISELERMKYISAGA